MMNKNIFVIGIYFMLLVFTSCVKEGEGDKDPIQSTPRLNSNYSLTLEGIVSTYSDEDIGYDFCTDVSTRSIQTNKLYGDSIVIYEVILSPHNIINRPKVSSYGFYVYWNPFEEPDLSLFDAVKDIINGNSLRKHHLQFIVGEQGGYANSFFYTNRSTDLDSSASSEIDIKIPENIECQVYGKRVAELNFQYSGFVYSSERADSLFVNNFDLQLYVPLSL